MNFLKGVKQYNTNSVIDYIRQTNSKICYSDIIIINHFMIARPLAENG